MNPTRRIQDPHYNPFHNRFHFPVHSRLDEMQSYTHMLNEPAALEHERGNNQHSRHLARALAGAFTLVLIVIFAAALLTR